MNSRKAANDNLGPLASLPVTRDDQCQSWFGGGNDDARANAPKRSNTPRPGDPDLASEVSAPDQTTASPVTTLASQVAERSAEQLRGEREHRFCSAIAQCPLQPSSQYVKLAGMSPKTAIKVRQSLVKRGLVRERRVDSSQRGGSAILLELTPGGVCALNAFHQNEMKENRS